jgi:hypothetical protein
MGSTQNHQVASTEEVARTSVTIALAARQQDGWQRRGSVEAGTVRDVLMLVTPSRENSEHVQIGLARINPPNAAPWHVHEGHEEFCHIL